MVVRLVVPLFVAFLSGVPLPHPLVSNLSIDLVFTRELVGRRRRLQRGMCPKTGAKPVLPVAISGPADFRSLPQHILARVVDYTIQHMDFIGTLTLLWDKPGRIPV